MDVYLRLSDKRRSHLLSFPLEGNIYYPSIIHCGYQENIRDDSRDLKSHDHDVFHFILFLEGENEFLFNNSIIPCTEGLFVICSPGDSHNFYPLNKGITKYIELTFEYISHEKRMDRVFEVILFQLFNFKGMGKKFYMLDEEGRDSFKDLHGQLYYTLLSDSRKNMDYKVDLILQTIFLFVMELMGSEETLSGVKKISANRAKQLKEIIHNRFPSKLNLEEISRDAGISKSYLIKKFRQEYGTTPVDYDRRLRINAAADLIVSTNRTMEDIALSLGFCDVFYFIKTFKQYKGVTPGKYR